MKVLLEQITSGGIATISVTQSGDFWLIFDGRRLVHDRSLDMLLVAAGEVRSPRLSARAEDWILPDPSGSIESTDRRSD